MKTNDGFLETLDGYSRRKLPENKWRSYLLFQNQDPALTIAMRIGMPGLGGLDGLLILPGQYMEFGGNGRQSTPTEEIYFSTTAGQSTSLVFFIEGTDHVE